MAMGIQAMATKKLRAVHPGDILRNDFLEPLGTTSYRSAKELGVTADRHSVPRAAAQCHRGNSAATGAVFRDERAVAA
jgi:hypothetical protein